MEQKGGGPQRKGVAGMATDTLPTGFAGTFKLQAELRELIDRVASLEEMVSHAETHVLRRSVARQRSPSS